MAEPVNASSEVLIRRYYELYNERRIQEAAELFDELTTNDEFSEFLTLRGYERLN